jgi:replication initiation and membrane attachment protein DnaB
MYYQELIERLWRFNENTRLGATAIAMYLYLLKLGEQNNSYVIKISDTVLSNILGIHRNTVKPFREKLKNFGLILYTTKNGFPCTYRILLNYSFESFKEESEKI